MAEIFVSYSRSDKQFLDGFIPLLRKVYGNDSLWYDYDINGGANWWGIILTQIQECSLFIYLVSNESLESTYCQAELREALRLHKTILPVVVRRLRPPYPGTVPDDLSNVLRHIQYIDMAEGFGDALTIASLYAAINELLELEADEIPEPTHDHPVPQPPVQDKKTWQSRFIERRMIIVAAIITGIFAVSAVFVTLTINTPTPTPPITIDLSSPTVINSSPTATIDGNVTPINVLEQETDAAQTAVVLQSTTDAATLAAQQATDEATQQYLNEMETATARAATQVSYNVTATVARATSIVVFQTNVPLTTAQRGVFNNAQWANHTPVVRAFQDNVEMVLVPVGCFMMGSENGDRDEEPVNQVCFNQPFWIDRTEVTQGQFTRLDGVKSSSASFLGENHPVVNINWLEARDFCEQRGARLPTEAEWEYAARGVDELEYPWGNQWDGSRLSWNRLTTVDVGSIPTSASWVGAVDMSGNVREWVNTIYHIGDFQYPYDANDGRETDSDSQAVVRVIRGGSWRSNSSIELRSAERRGAGAYSISTERGFRCARDY
jgi:formylglycine-generating enzyme required for sulfatase activity